MPNADFGATASDYAAHRAGFPDSFFERLRGRGIGLAGQRLVDLGTGTGTLARGFARAGCRVIGIDRSATMLDAASRLHAEAGVAVEYRVAPAEATGLATSCADIVTAGQCWHWFDRPRAAREVARLLVSGGQVVVAHFDWLPLAGNLVEATESLIHAHNPSWDMGGGSGLHPAWLRDLAEAGFHSLETSSYDVVTTYSPAGWRGRIRASAGVGGSLPPARVDDFDHALAELLASRFPGETLAVPHRVFTVLGVAPD